MIALRSDAISYEFNSIPILLEGNISNKVIIFDFDGVLADSLDMMLSYPAQASRELGYPSQPSPADLEVLDTMSIDSLGRQLNLPEEIIPAYKQRVIDLLSSSHELPPIFDGMVEVIVSLASMYSLGIVTGNSSGMVRSSLDRYNLLQHFELILTEDNLGTRVEKLRTIVKQLGESNSEAFLVGDAVSDIYAAREVMLKSIAVTWGHQTRERLLRAQPDFLVDSPEELLLILNE